MQARSMLAGATALAAALGGWVMLQSPAALPAAVATAPGEPAPRPAAARPPAVLPAAPPAAALPAPIAVQAEAATAAAPRPAAPARITVTAPATLRVGEVAELIVSLGAQDVAVGELSLVLQFDAALLQPQAADAGDWAAAPGVHSRFSAEVSDAADRLRLRTGVSARARQAGRGVAVVQVQAMAPGATTVLLSDVAVHDLAGRPLPFQLASTHLPFTVEAPAP